MVRFLVLALATVTAAACAHPIAPAPPHEVAPVAAVCLRPATPATDGARLSELRSEIDCVDRVLARLAGERLEIARRIGAVKRAMGAPVVDTVREALVAERFARLAGAEGVRPETADALIRALILAARAEQEALPD